MTKAALIYLAMIVVVTGLITGLPMNLISLGTLEEANASSQGTQPKETVAQKA